MKDKQINKIITGIVIALALLTFAVISATAQGLNPTFRSVSVDTLRQRQDTLWISDREGSTVYLRTTGDSLYFGDVTGEKSISLIDVAGATLNFVPPLTKIGSDVSILSTGSLVSDTIKARIIENNPLIDDALTLSAPEIEVTGLDFIKLTSTGSDIDIWAQYGDVSLIGGVDQGIELRPNGGGTPWFYLDSNYIYKMESLTPADTVAYLSDIRDADASITCDSSSVSYSLDTLNVGDSTTITDLSINMTGQKQSVNNLKIVISDTIAQDGSANSGTDYQHQNVYEAFKITANITTRIQSLAVWVKNTGTITNVVDYVEMIIYTDNAGEPGTAIGTIIEQERYGYITTSFLRFDGQIAPLEITSGTDYWIVLNWNTAPVGGNVYYDTDNTGTNNHAYSADGATWTLTSNKSIRYLLFGQRVAGIHVECTNFAAIDAYGTTEYGVKMSSIWDYGGIAWSDNNKGLVAGTMYGDAAMSATGNYGSAYIGTSINNNVMELSTTGAGLAASLYSENGRGADITSVTNNGLKVESSSQGATSYSIKARHFGAGYAIDCEADTGITLIARSDLSNAIYSISTAPSSAATYSINTGGGFANYSRANSGIADYAYSTNNWGSYSQSDNSYASVHFNNESTTNATEGVVRISRGTSGTAANGIGGRLELYTEDDSGTENEAGRVTWTLTDVTNGSEEGNIKLGTMHDAVNVDRMIVGSDVIIDETASALCRIDLSTGEAAGGVIKYSIIAKNAGGTEVQIKTGQVKYSALNISAAYTTTIDAVDAGAVDALSTGTLTEAWTITTGTNQIFININANSSITTPDIKILYTIENQSGNNILIQ